MPDIPPLHAFIARLISSDREEIQTTEKRSTGRLNLSRQPVNVVVNYSSNFCRPSDVEDVIANKSRRDSRLAPVFS